jgi:hypothetical protein
MRKHLDSSPNGHPHGRQMREVLDQIDTLIVDGVRHGFFEYSITCEIVSTGKRELVIRAGKSHKFTIPEAEVPN